MLVSPMLWGQSPRQRFGRTAQTGGRADADRTAGKRHHAAPTALVVPDLVGKSIVAARLPDVAIVRERRPTAPPAGGVEPQVLLLEITRPADGKPTGEVLSQ